MKREKTELLHEDIFDKVSSKMDFMEYDRLVKDMIAKRLLRATSDKHYDLY